jgi:hypothetical protein
MRIRTVGPVQWAWCAARLVIALGVAACSDDAGDGSSFPGGSGGNTAQSGSGGSQQGSGGTGSGGSGSTGSGSGGTSAGTGGSDGGGGKDAGAGSSGSGSGGASDADAGGMTCTLACGAGSHCELVEVTCIRAPCPPQAMCVGDADGGQACGTRGGQTCADGEYCDFPSGSLCGAADGGGTCKEKPFACTKELHLVCGCDDHTYNNPCEAASQGVSVLHDGEC